MIYKIFYQEIKNEVPVREKTKAFFFFLEASSEREVRLKLKDRSINIEFIQPVEGAFLEYERQNEDFKVLEI
ncbi:DNA-dependent RNA polymerase auxiliary subunit epsilon family protein [Bacillus aquiflavi]|uniref:DNA-dependent RNA polymerase subunit epsilon n=1 Tax=Bacillus aquiflavi TaxID=2672567 RepID=UPI001CA955FD|nr:DNA-directed RNA polymerase subunit epsilon [Bacillus aquiflavi]UAC49237.1 DNA-dependent RNA polymerase auxiliary subunit epsilon family protein [Bacillus aquiflavi]